MTASFRCISVLAAASLLATALSAAPVSARAATSCPRFKPSPIVTDSERGLEARKEPVTIVTDKATKENPIVIEFEQEPAVWWWAGAQRGPIIDGNRYFNVQVDTRKRSVGLHARLEWPLVAQDLDLYMYDEDGVMVAWSEAVNAAPAEVTGSTGGPGYEYIGGYGARRCEGFTLEDNAMWATPQEVQLKLWLGPVGL